MIEQDRKIITKPPRPNYKARIAFLEKALAEENKFHVEARKDLAVVAEKSVELQREIKNLKEERKEMEKDFYAACAKSSRLFAENARLRAVVGNLARSVEKLVDEEESDD